MSTSMRPNGLRGRLLLLCVLVLCVLTSSTERTGAALLGTVDGSFETDLGGVYTSGDVRLITSLGPLRPPQGTQAVLLTTAPDAGVTPADAHLSLIRLEEVQVPLATPQLRLEYAFLSSETVPSLLDERFTVHLVLLSPEGNDILLQSDTFSRMYPAPLTGYAWQTGFRAMVADLAAVAGTSVTLELRLNDSGDGRVDSAVLVDDIRWVSAATPQACSNYEIVSVSAGVALFFDASCSAGREGPLVDYRWDFDDGTIGSGVFIEHVYADDGIYQATLTVTDHDGNTDRDTFLVMVGSIGQAPRIVSSPPVLVEAYTPYRYAVIAEDADLAAGDRLTFRLQQAPPGMVIDPQTGVVTWLPDLTVPQAEVVIIVVTDTLGRSDIQTFTLVVAPQVYVVASDDSGRLYASNSHGDGTFTPLQFVDVTGPATRGAVSADFDGDGDFDLISGHAQNDSLQLYFYERQGQDFSPPLWLGAVGDSVSAAGNALMDMAAADVNNDGAMDFVVNGASDASWLWLQHTPLTLLTETLYETDFESDDQSWEEVNCQTGFGREMTTAASGSWSMRVYASGDDACLRLQIPQEPWSVLQGPTLSFAYRIPAGTAVGLVVDVDGYGQLFLGGSPTVTPGNLPGVPVLNLIDDDQWHRASINLSRSLHQQWPEAANIHALQWWMADNAPAKTQFWLDDLRITRRVYGSGFEVSLLPPAGGHGRGLDAADVDGDGNIDLARGGSSDGQVFLYRGDGSGEFITTPVAAPGLHPYGVVLADFDNDQIVDLIANNDGTGEAWFFAGNGDGTFRSGSPIASLDTDSYAAYATYDFNHDGQQDIVAVNDVGQQLLYYPGSGTAAFEAPRLLGTTLASTLGIAVPAGRVPGQPFSVAVLDQQRLAAGESVTFDARASFDDGSIIDYQWDFGDAATGNGVVVTHLFAHEGTYHVVLTITDDTGLSDRRRFLVQVNGTAPVADTGGPYVFNEAVAIHGVWHVQLDGGASHDTETQIIRYQWDFDASDGLGLDATSATPRHIYAAPGTYTITLTVFDAVEQSHTATSTVTIQPGAAPVAVLSGPDTVDESAATLGQWSLPVDLNGSGDDEAIAAFVVDWGDGSQSTQQVGRDSFEDGDFTHNPSWTAIGSGWQVIDGQLHQLGTSSDWVWLQDLNTVYGDFSLEVDCKATSSSGQMGIVFRHDNTPGSTQTLRLTSAAGENAWRLTDWTRNKTLAYGGDGWQPDVWYHLRLVVIGSNIQLYVTPESGQETLQLQTNRATQPPGGIGFLSKGAQVIYDNLRVTLLEDSLRLTHLYDTIGEYQVKLTVTDHALQHTTATLTTHVVAGEPPVAQFTAPALLDETMAEHGQWQVSFDAGDSHDDTAIATYHWDFGDGGSGSGSNPTYTYTAPGTYTVTLTVTDHAGQQATAAATVTIIANDPPVARAGGPYAVGEVQASFGVWEVTLDGRTSTDDVALEDFTWLFAPVRETFDGQALDPVQWLTSPGVTRDGALFVDGNGRWSDGYVFSTMRYEPAPGMVWEAQVQPVNTAGAQLAMWGLRDGSAMSFRDTAMVYAIVFADGQLAVYEGGVSKTLPAHPYTPGMLYDLRLTVHATGARYEFKPASASTWTLLYDASHISHTPLQVGGMVHSGTFLYDNNLVIEVQRGPIITKRYHAPGVYPVTLQVRDRASQVALDPTTITVQAGAPPVAHAGGPYPLIQQRLVQFSSRLSHDDYGLTDYHWDFGDGTRSHERNPSHLYTTPGAYTVTLTVTDHARQRDTATTTVDVSRLRFLENPVGVLDSQSLQLSGTAAVEVHNTTAATFHTFSVIIFEDTQANGRFDADLDTFLGQVTRSALAAGEMRQLSVPVDGTVTFRDTILHAFLDTGSADSGLNLLNYASSNQGCATLPAVGSFTPVLEWAWQGSTTLPQSNQVMTTPMVLDLTADGIPDIIFTTFEGNQYKQQGYIRVLNGTDGRELFTVTEHPIRAGSTLAVGDIDGDQRPEIIAVSETGSELLAFEHDGTFKWRTAPIPNPGDFGSVGYGGAALADLNGDGTPEIIVGSTVLNNDGTVLWQGIYGHGASYAGMLSAVADLDGQGDPEVLAGNTAYHADGSLYWHNSEIPDGLTAVANLDADPWPEIVLVALSQVYLLAHDGTVQWGPVVLPGGVSKQNVGGPPTVADVDGDGVAEIGIAGGFAYTVFEADGRLKWSRPTLDNSSSVTGSSVFDFDGDGKAEIVYGDQFNLFIYRGHDGAILWKIPSPSGTLYEMPVIVDVDNDGQAEILKASNNYVYPGVAGIQVYGDANGSWVRTRQLWNQHTYHITNILDDGTIPEIEEASWNSNNSYRRNLPQLFDLFTSPDITASFLRLQSSGESVSLISRVGNGGLAPVPAGTSVAYYDGDPHAGGRLLGTVNTTTVLPPGAFEDVTLHVHQETTDTVWIVADDDGTQRHALEECRRDNNIHHSGLPVRLNQPPLAVAGGPYSIPEGLPLQLDATGSSDPDGDTLTYLWDVDQDGVFDDAVGATPQLTFADDGTFTLTLHVSDGKESQTDQTLLVVHNVAPLVYAVSAATVLEGNLWTSAGTVADPGADSWTGTINYGDGAGEQALPINAEQMFHLSHTYVDNGVYTVTITVTDDDGGQGQATTTVTVTNAAPVVDAGPDQSLVENSTLTLAPATYADIGTADTHTAMIDWGDGSSEPGTLAAASSSGTVAGAHHYDDNGAFTITICLSDKDGATGCDTLLVDVANLPPVATLDTTGSVALWPQDQSFFLQQVSTSHLYRLAATDPGSDDVTFTWLWGDGSAQQPHTFLNNGSTPDPMPPYNQGAMAPFAATHSAAHAYTLPGVYTLTAHVVDDDGGQSQEPASMPVVVTDNATCTKTIGFWQRQFDINKKPKIPKVTLDAYLATINLASNLFSETERAGTRVEAWSILQSEETETGQENMRLHARRQTLAAWLNFARGALAWDATIPGLARPFSTVMADIEAIFVNPSATYADYVRANDAAVLINERDSNNRACRS